MARQIRNSNKNGGKCKGFALTVQLTEGNFTTLNFSREHHAEHVLRGLVHSGYSVTIHEQIMDYPDGLRELDEWDRYDDYDVSEPVASGYSVGATLNLAEIDDAPVPAPVTTELHAYAASLQRMTDTSASD